MESKLPLFLNDAKKFALRLNYISSSAYDFDRESIGKDHLPNSRTIQIWKSNNDGSPGITQQNLERVGQKGRELGNIGVVAEFCLSIDGMGIIETIEYVSHKNRVYGYVDFGEQENFKVLPSDVASNFEPETAKNGMFFMLVGINTILKSPIAYVLINKLTGKKLSVLAKQLLLTLYKNKIFVKAMTFDGDPAHFNLARE